MTDYTSVKVPKVLSEKIQNNEYFKSMGYRSVSEFILDCVRVRLQKQDSVM